MENYWIKNEKISPDQYLLLFWLPYIVLSFCPTHGRAFRKWNFWVSNNTVCQIIQISKMRRNGDRENSKIRSALEITAVISSFLLIALQKDLNYLIATQPVPNLIIPVLSIAPYIYIRFKKTTTQETQDSELL